MHCNTEKQTKKNAKDGRAKDSMQRNFVCVHASVCVFCEQMSVCTHPCARVWRLEEDSGDLLYYSRLRLVTSKPQWFPLALPPWPCTHVTMAGSFLGVLGSKPLGPAFLPQLCLFESWFVRKCSELCDRNKCTRRAFMIINAAGVSLPRKTQGYTLITIIFPFP